jgi:hypothetical protein
MFHSNCSPSLGQFGCVQCRYFKPCFYTMIRSIFYSTILWYYVLFSLSWQSIYLFMYHFSVYMLTSEPSRFFVISKVGTTNLGIVSCSLMFMCMATFSLEWNGSPLSNLIWYCCILQCNMIKMKYQYLVLTWCQVPHFFQNSCGEYKATVMSLTRKLSLKPCS